MRRDFKVWAGRQGRRESVLPTTPSLPTPTAEDQTREGLKNKQVLIPLTRLYDIKKKIGRLKEEEEERERFTHMLPLLCCCHFLKKGGFSLFKDSSIIKPVTPVNCISQHISRKRRTDFIKDHLKGFFFLFIIIQFSPRHTFHSEHTHQQDAKKPIYPHEYL